MNHLIKSFILIALCIFLVSISSYAEEQKQLTPEEPEKTAEYWFNLGEDYYDNEKYENAIEAYKKAIEIKPDYSKGYVGLGITYGKSSMYQEAIYAFKHAIRINPDYAEAYYNLGLAYEKSGMYKESI